LAQLLTKLSSGYHPSSVTPAQQAVLWKEAGNSLVAHLLGIDGIHTNSFANG